MDHEAMQKARADEMIADLERVIDEIHNPILVGFVTATMIRLQPLADKISHTEYAKVGIDIIGTAHNFQLLLNQLEAYESLCTE